LTIVEDGYTYKYNFYGGLPMLMKVFNKGQVVIPNALRKELGIEPGDMLDVAIDKDARAIRLKKPAGMKAHSLAGSLAKYNRRNKFPTKIEIKTALAKGLAREK
jgi:AbrB family looped-hinge helix DNA binding protein